MPDTKGSTARALAIGASMLAVSCTDTMGSPAPHTRGNVISDQLHNGGTEGFVFLPPMVPRPAVLGENVWGVRPIVRIDEIRADGTTVRTLASFTATSGPGGERVRTHEHGRPCDRDDDDRDDDDDDYYYARWNTHDAHLSTTARYRARVFVPAVGGGQRELGFADVDVVRTEREFRSVDTDNFTPLVNGRMLRVKFRLERAAVDRDRDGVLDWVDNCINASNRDQRDSNRDGQGDACECVGVSCAPLDACHTAGVCNTRDGSCSTPTAANGTACPLANAAAACTDGVCALTTCATGFADCDGAAANGCETPSDTVSNCGGCGRTCDSGPHSAALCTAGTCALACAPDFADVNGSAADGCEVDLSTDVDHCGRAGNACGARAGATASCAAGVCVFACDAGLADCNGDPSDGCERPTVSDENNCGGCGVTCSGGRACVAGACSATECLPNRADCDGNGTNGCEVSLSTDAAHCGVCSTACSFAHAAATCASGSCAMGSCATGYADGDRDASNGCEVDLLNDPAHCGSLSTVCASRANAIATCASGTCGFTCVPSYADADRVATNGCEVDLSTDINHCGDVGHACPAAANATVTCARGACGFTCASDFADVDHVASNGCEVDLSTDVNHCGSETRACDVRAGTVTACVAGDCAYACEAHLGDCDGDTANGCEARLDGDDVNHCGACDRACAVGAHAAPTCASGVCGIACESGYTDCNGDPSDGCEVQLSNDPAHCGSCGNVCPVAAGASSAVCTGGRCGVVCAAGRGDCDADASNGCEADLASPGNCGSCGMACSFANAAATCSATLSGPVCGFGVCDAGFGDCDGAQSNGCETPLDTVAHCGGCGVTCSVTNGTAACVNHACAVGACDAGYELRDGACVDVDECATAGRCGSGFACVNTAGSFRCDNADPCMPNPCHNFGVCERRGDDYVCTCNGYNTGRNCDTPTACASRPCQNGGSCVDSYSTTSYMCFCPWFYEGANCEILPPCDRDPCQNGGTCTNNWPFEGRRCACPPGYLGSSCEIPPPCSPNPCQNGGTCSVTGTTYACACDAYHTGTNCEALRTCASNPCLNGGACTDSPSGFSCGCPIGFAGSTCARVLSCAPARSVASVGACGRADSKCIFETSCGYSGAQIQGLTGADEICQAHAQAAGLRGTYRAWLSTAAVSAASRLNHSTVPYVDVFGFQISANWTDLTNDNTITGAGNIALLNRQQNGITSSAPVWTGTNSAGVGYLDATSNCLGWLSDASTGVRGNSGLADGGEYTHDGYIASCGALGRLYCFEQ